MQIMIILVICYCDFVTIKGPFSLVNCLCGIVYRDADPGVLAPGDGIGSEEAPVIKNREQGASYTGSSINIHHSVIGGAIINNATNYS